MNRQVFYDPQRKRWKRLRSIFDVLALVGLLMTAVMHFVADDRDPWGLLARYMEALAPGSYLSEDKYTDFVKRGDWRCFHDAMCWPYRLWAP